MEIILPLSITTRSTKFTRMFSTNWSHRLLITCAKTRFGPGWHRDSGTPCCVRIAGTVGRGLQPSPEAKQPLPISMQELEFSRHQRCASAHATATIEVRISCTLSLDRKSTRLNSSHPSISYAVFCLKKKNNTTSVNCRQKR